MILTSLVMLAKSCGRLRQAALESMPIVLCTLRSFEPRVETEPPQIGSPHYKKAYTARLAVISFCVLPGVTRAIFSAFDCVSFEFEGTETFRYLRRDLRIRCSDDSGLSTSEHQRLQTLAVFLAFVWPVATPLIFMFLLRKAREAIKDARQSPLAAAISFLWREYKPAYFYWEPIDLGAAATNRITQIGRAHV